MSTTTLLEELTELRARIESWRSGYTEASHDRDREREKWIKCRARVEALEATLDDMMELFDDGLACMHSEGFIEGDEYKEALEISFAIRHRSE